MASVDRVMFCYGRLPSWSTVNYRGCERLSLVTGNREPGTPLMFSRFPESHQCQ